jgi:hypothetical protein
MFSDPALADPEEGDSMPATYTIDQAAGVVRIVCSGVFTNQEMIDCMEQLYRDPARKPGMPSLIDCRGVETMQVSPAGCQAAATIEATIVDPVQPPWAVAVIAPQDEVYWIARTFEVLRAGSPQTVRVFRQPSDAERWLTAFKVVAPIWVLCLGC